MSQQLKLIGKIEAIATDRKAGYVLKIRVIKSDIETDARLLDLRYFPTELTMDFEDILALEPAIDYSDMDEQFDPDREDFEDANTDSED